MRQNFEKQFLTNAFFRSILLLDYVYTSSSYQTDFLIFGNKMQKISVRMIFFDTYRNKRITRSAKITKFPQICTKWGLAVRRKIQICINFWQGHPILDFRIWPSITQQLNQIKLPAELSILVRNEGVPEMVCKNMLTKDTKSSGKLNSNFQFNISFHSICRI